MPDQLQDFTARMLGVIDQQARDGAFLIEQDERERARREAEQRADEDERLEAEYLESLADGSGLTP